MHRNLRLSERYPTNRWKHSLSEKKTPWCSPLTKDNCKLYVHREGQDGVRITAGHASWFYAGICPIQEKSGVLLLQGFCVRWKVRDFIIMCLSEAEVREYELEALVQTPPPITSPEKRKILVVT
jgi:hypothetical protein